MMADSQPAQLKDYEALKSLQNLDIRRLAKYPIAIQARDMLNILSLDSNVLPREAIIYQSRYRLDRALKEFVDNIVEKRHGSYQVYSHNSISAITETVEFYSFFASAMAVSKEGFARNVFANSESHRMWVLFMRENEDYGVELIKDVSGVTLTKTGLSYSMRVEKYLELGTTYEFFGDQSLRLVNMSLKNGLVYFDHTNLGAMFKGLVRAVIIQGVTSLRKNNVKIPMFIQSLVNEIQAFIPRQTPGQRQGFNYIDRLLQTKITDGRHRSIWLVLAPYLVNVKSKSPEETNEILREYINDSRFKQIIKSQVRRAARIGLMPPTKKKLQTEHPDLFEIYSRAGVFS